MKQNLILLFACLATQIALAELSLGEKNAAENVATKREWESWNTPFQPFRLIGNIHYVGASGISSFLITALADKADAVLKFIRAQKHKA